MIGYCSPTVSVFRKAIRSLFSREVNPILNRLSQKSTTSVAMCFLIRSRSNQFPSGARCSENHWTRKFEVSSGFWEDLAENGVANIA